MAATRRRTQQQNNQDSAAARVPDWSPPGACEGACGYSTCAGRSRWSSGVGREIGFATDLVSSQQSLAWDNFTPPIQQEDNLIFDNETSSTSALASNTLQECELEQFIDKPDRLTPVDERSESRASTGKHERTMAGENAAGGPND